LVNLTSSHCLANEIDVTEEYVYKKNLCVITI